MIDLFTKKSKTCPSDLLSLRSTLAEDELELAMLKRDLITMELEQEMDARIIAAMNEELAAYSDFIASLDDK